jgi:hypothetical protein
VNQSHRFGLTLKMGWEHPPAGWTRFIQPQRRLPHVPSVSSSPTWRFRWRPFFNQNHAEYVPLLHRTCRREPATGAAYARLPTAAMSPTPGSAS